MYVFLLIIWIIPGTVTGIKEREICRGDAMLFLSYYNSKISASKMNEIINPNCSCRDQGDLDPGVGE